MVTQFQKLALHQDTDFASGSPVTTGKKKSEINSISAVVYIQVKVMESPRKEKKIISMNG